MSNETDIYRKLQQHLDDLPIGFPSTESGVEIKILKELFTPEEAEVATKLGIKFKSLEDIYKQVNNTEISIIKLEQLLDNLVSKGAIAPDTVMVVDPEVDQPRNSGELLQGQLSGETLYNQQENRTKQYPDD